jgi:Protein of unknown function (DUF3572)
MSRASRDITRESAESIAAQGLGFLAADPARLVRFLDLTGLSAEQVRSRADTREFLGAVLEHIVNDESLLLVFAAHASILPESIAPALAMLQQPGVDRGPGA